MMGRLSWSALLVLAFAVSASGQSKKVGTKGSPDFARPTTAEQAQLFEAAGNIRKTLASIPKADDLGFDDQRLHADVAIFAKAIEWMLRHDEFWQQDSLAMLRETAKKGVARARLLASGKHPWTDADGRVVRAYFSPVDGSIQPYLLIVPKGCDKTKKPLKRLDVVLHGRNANLNEVWFIAKNDGKPTPANTKNLELHVYGRGNNAYRWAGEQDVHDALNIVADEYGIDRRFVVLRGFSMGGAGAWHLGLHHPTKWVSVEAGAGFTDTLSKTKLGPLPDYQSKALHIYDAVDYSINASNVSIVGYGGENDPQLLAAQLVRNRLLVAGYTLRTSGLIARCQEIPFAYVVGAKMGHRVDDVSAKAMAAFHADAIEDRKDKLAKLNLLDSDAQVWSKASTNFRSTTFTTKFGEVAPGIKIHRLIRHYEPANIVGSFIEQRLILKTENVRALEIRRPDIVSVQIDKQILSFDDGDMRSSSDTIWLEIGTQGWARTTRPSQLQGSPLGKRPNLQGPIDDAFTRPFMCVRGTGTPWNPAVHQWAMQRLDRFAALWDKNFRGRIRIETDTDYKPRDAKIYNLILFGDPGSNRVIANLLKRLPLEWTKDRLKLSGDFAAADHAPALIYPNPDNPVNYVVLNSGHTFDAPDFKGTNALLFPHLGDFAVVRVSSTANPIQTAGFFDDEWKLP